MEGKVAQQYPSKLTLMATTFSRHERRPRWKEATQVPEERNHGILGLYILLQTKRRLHNARNRHTKPYNSQMSDEDMGGMAIV